MSMNFKWRDARIAVLYLLPLVVAAPAPGATVAATVTLSPASVDASGIKVAPLVASRHAPQAQGIATVLDPQPLLALSAQLQGERAALGAAVTQSHADTTEAQRLRELYRHGGNAALHAVQAAKAVASTAHAKQVAAAANYAAARSGARAQWGTTLTALAARGVPALDDYADGRATLLAVVLPVGSKSPAAGTIRIQTNNGETVPASLLGPSPRADVVVQGPTYFYRSEGVGLRIGQRLTATVPQGAPTRRGVIVPDAAVIWYAGQPWVYVETEAGHFQRRPLAQTARTATGWFQASGFHAGERVVVRGGELLLSQELLPPPGTQPAGDDDD